MSTSSQTSPKRHKGDGGRPSPAPFPRGVEEEEVVVVQEEKHASTPMTAHTGLTDDVHKVKLGAANDMRVAWTSAPRNSSIVHALAAARKRATAPAREPSATSQLPAGSGSPPWGPPPDQGRALGSLCLQQARAPSPGPAAAGPDVPAMLRPSPLPACQPAIKAAPAPYGDAILPILRQGEGSPQSSEMRVAWTSAPHNSSIVHALAAARKRATAPAREPSATSQLPAGSGSPPWGPPPDQGRALGSLCPQQAPAASPGPAAAGPNVPAMLRRAPPPACQPAIKASISAGAPPPASGDMFEEARSVHDSDFGSSLWQSTAPAAAEAAEEVSSRAPAAQGHEAHSSPSASVPHLARRVVHLDTFAEEVEKSPLPQWAAMGGTAVETAASGGGAQALRLVSDVGMVGGVLAIAAAAAGANSSLAAEASKLRSHALRLQCVLTMSTDDEHLRRMLLDDLVPISLGLRALADAHATAAWVAQLPEPELDLAITKY